MLTTSHNVYYRQIVRITDIELEWYVIKKILLKIWEYIREYLKNKEYFDIFKGILNRNISLKYENIVLSQLSSN